VRLRGPDPPHPRRNTMRFAVQNMTCAHCVRTITRALQAVDSGVEVAVDLAGGTVTVNGVLDAAQAIAAMQAEGYPAQALAEAAVGGCCRSSRA
jgi:copper chaperone